MATTFYAAMEDVLLVGQRRNGGWDVWTALDGLPLECVAVDERNPERVYCGTFGQGLWRSEDGGATWRRSDDGIGRAEVMSLAVSAFAGESDAGVVYAGTEPSALFVSTDGGRHWEERPAFQDIPSRSTWSFPPRPWTHHVRWIAPDPHVSERVYVAVELGGVMRTDDGGQTWVDRRPDGPMDVHTAATHPLAPGRVYTAEGDGFGRAGRGYAESRDADETWGYPDDGLRHGYLWSIAVDPGDPDTVLVSAAAGPYPAHNRHAAESYLYRRAGGGSWEPSQTGLPAPRGTIVPVLTANALEPGVFYALSNHGLFRSPDRGEHWEPLDLPWADALRRQHARGLAVVDAAL
ncbi:MAG: glycosyl hydrolase [Anaerolineae bacterium]